MKKRFVPILVSSLFSLCACVNTTAYTSTLFAFDTVVEIGIYKNNPDLLTEISKIVKEYNKLFDAYSSSNVANIYTINNSDSPIVVSEKLYDALVEANRYIDETDGYFNPLVGNLSNAWKEALDNGHVLSNEDIDMYLHEMNSSSLIFDEETHSVGISGNASIDLGAFAKGYTLSKIWDFMANRQDGRNYYVNAGSSSVILGKKPKTSDFNIGLKYIDNAYLKLHGTSVGTSAVYEQYFSVGGKNYSHIVNPFTGSTIPNYDFVMVINEDATLTDVLSTALMSMDLETIKQYESKFNLRVLVSQNKEIIYKTSGVEVLYH